MEGAEEAEQATEKEGFSLGGAEGSEGIQGVLTRGLHHRLLLDISAAPSAPSASSPLNPPELGAVAAG